MKTGMYFGFGFELDPRERCEMIREAGFDNVFLWWGINPLNSREEKTPELVRECGLYVENVHIPYNDANFIWSEDDRGDKLTEYYAACVRSIAEHGIPVMVVHLTNGDDLPPPNMRGVERLERLNLVAKEYGVYVALENLRKPEYLDYVFPKLTKGNIQFCFDSGHEFCHSPNAALIEKYGDMIKAAHIHDNDGTGDQHLIPGDGKIDWRSIAERLKAKGFDGAVSLELHQEAAMGMEPRDMLKKAYIKAREIADMFK